MTEPLGVSFTHAELMAATIPDPTASDLVRDRLCDGGCLVAVGPIDGCGCVCGGYYHGLLADAVVDVAPENRRMALTRASDITSQAANYVTTTTRHNWHRPALHAGWQTGDRWATVCGLGRHRRNEVTPVRQDGDPVPWKQTRDGAPIGGDVCQRCYRKTGRWT